MVLAIPESADNQIAYDATKGIRIPVYIIQMGAAIKVLLLQKLAYRVFAQWWLLSMAAMGKLQITDFVWLLSELQNLAMYFLYWTQATLNIKTCSVFHTL